MAPELRARRNGIYKGRAKGTTESKPARAEELQARGLSAPEIAQVLGVSTRTIFRSLQADDRAAV
jgi:IS30 family transposase